jgi:uncharacterized protein (DUF2141 family)
MIRGTSVGIALAVLLAAQAQAADLRLTVEGMHSSRGELLIGLYDNSKGFANAIANASKGSLTPDPGRIVGVSIRAKLGSQVVIFARLPPGRYAAIAIDDENDDGRLDVNALGVPTEGYGFSNNARGFLGAPSFEAAAVTVGTVDLTTSIALVYPSVPSAEENSEYDRFTGGLFKPDQ